MAKETKQETLEEKLRDEYAADPALFCLRLNDGIAITNMRLNRIESILERIDPTAMALAHLSDRLSAVEFHLQPKKKEAKDGE